MRFAAARKTWGVNAVQRSIILLTCSRDFGQERKSHGPRALLVTSRCAIGTFAIYKFSTFELHYTL